MSKEWTAMEEGVVRQFFKKVSDRELVGMLPGRNYGSIVKRARLLGLTDSNDNGTSSSNGVSTPSSSRASEIERLEAELVLKKAEAELEDAEDALDLFEGEAVRQFRAHDLDLEEFIKNNQDARGKLVAAISNARRKVFVAKLKMPS
jgi:hypothetical protein